jgi:hypothetical protein
MNYLNSKIPEKWLGKRGPISWPPRSPDLSPSDFFLWGYLKDRVYETELGSISALKRAISETVRGIPVNMCERTCRSVKERLEELQKSGGGHLGI